MLPRKSFHNVRPPPVLTKSSTGFGSTNTGGAFGAPKPAFGATATTGGGLFGNNNTATSGAFGGGGFGSTANNTTSAFGGGNTTGSLFGQNKTAGGFGGSTGGSLFPGSSNAGGFGNTNNHTASTGVFGGGIGTALGVGVPESQGTANPPYSATTDKEPNGVTNHFQSITCQKPYEKYSFEVSLVSIKETSLILTLLGTSNSRLQRWPEVCQ